MLSINKSLIALFFCCIILSGQAFAKDYDKEYQNSARMLDIINAKTAYDMFITGKGVKVGVFDTSTRPEHPEFADGIAVMPAYLSDGSLYHPDWSDDDTQHGTHVSGIIAANRDGVGMHGVAYEADLFTMTVIAKVGGSPANVNIDFKEFFELYPQVRIVNNSWGFPFFPYMPYDAVTPSGDKILTGGEAFSSVQGFVDYMHSGKVPSESYEMAQYALENKDKVFVWAAGNDGFPVGSFESFMPRYMGSELGNWLNVASAYSPEISRNATGGFIFESGGISNFSDLAAGMERWTVLAPGSVIYSAHAKDFGYINYSGTSMAAPVVSGVLALVQQKFPWMTGKQLVDTVLSTANNNIQFSDGYIIQLADQTRYVAKRADVVFTFIDQAAPALTKDQLKDMLEKNYNANPNDWGGLTLEALHGAIDIGHYVIKDNVNAEFIIGQGMVDAGKAMGGIAELDANRMTEDNVIQLDEIAQRHAVEKIDTKGYIAELYNDISQFKWDDKYHFKDYQTTANGGDPKYNAAAEALSGKDIGIMKTGQGHLILSGENTYAGATIVDGGTLSIARRADGGGGRLVNSDVVVRSGGTLSGNGNIETQIINDGIVAPGMFGLGVDVGQSANTVLTTANYAQGPEGTLLINFDSYGNYGKLNVTTVNTVENGKLVFNPLASYYTGKEYNLEIFEGQTPLAGSFTSATVNSLSPTLSFNLTVADINSYSLEVTRTEDSYRIYAAGATGWNLGNALTTIAPIARGDMQNLIYALDFSSPDGQEVTTALKTLGPETYDTLSQMGLKQQTSFNNFVMQRMLAQNKANFIAQNSENGGLAAGNASSQTPYQVWGQVLGSTAHQGEFDGVDGYTSSGVGFVTGLDYTWDSGLTAGLHAGFVKRSTTALGNHDAYTETDSFSFGLQANFAPDSWDGFYAMAQGRLGFEQNEMHRTVTIGTYSRSNQSEWTDFVGSFLVGGGKDWTVDKFSFGPLAWLEYSFVQRPEISESGGGATRLKMDATNYDSLRAALGVHAGYTDNISENLNLEFDLLASWQHELLDGSIATRTAFSGYDNASFNSKTPLLGRNTFGLQASVRLNHVDNYFAQLDVGGEMTDGNGQALTFGLKFGYNF